MKKKIFGAVVVVAIAVGAMINVNLNKVINKGDLAMANVEALAQSEQLKVGNVGWADFFHNYKGTAQTIPITTSNCTGGSVSYGGYSISVKSCTQYSYAAYTPCYDGGNRNECTSDNVTYI